MGSQNGSLYYRLVSSDGHALILMPRNLLVLSRQMTSPDHNALIKMANETLKAESCHCANFSVLISSGVFRNDNLLCHHPTDTWLNNNVIITSKRRRDAVLTWYWRCYFVVCRKSWHQDGYRFTIYCVMRAKSAIPFILPWFQLTVITETEMSFSWNFRQGPHRKLSINDNFRCSQRRKFWQNDDISVSLIVGLSQDHNRRMNTENGICFRWQLTKL